jgi:hypothetical protein
MERNVLIFEESSEDFSEAVTPVTGATVASDMMALSRRRDLGDVQENDAVVAIQRRREIDNGPRSGGRGKSKAGGVMKETSGEDLSQFKRRGERRSQIRRRWLFGKSRGLLLGISPTWR